MKIDFEGIHDRIHRISIPDSTEGGLFWSHDSKKLAFVGLGRWQARYVHRRVPGRADVRNC